MTTTFKNPVFTCNIILAGDSGVGKTAIFHRLRDRVFKGKDSPTVGIDITGIILEVEENVKVKVNLYDTAGLAQLRTLSGSYYKKAAGVILVYDTTKRLSFQNLQKWEEEAKEYHQRRDIPFVVVGNKVDKETEKEIDAGEVNSYMKQHEEEGWVHFNTSAVNGQNIEEVLNTITREIFDRVCSARLRMSYVWDGVTDYIPNMDPLYMVPGNTTDRCVSQ